MPDLGGTYHLLAFRPQIGHNNDQITSMHQASELQQPEGALNIALSVLIKVQTERNDAPAQVEALPDLLLVCKQAHTHLCIEHKGL